jgi:hypothetical protein
MAFPQNWRKICELMVANLYNTQAFYCDSASASLSARLQLIQIGQETSGSSYGTDTLPQILVCDFYAAIWRWGQ